MNSADNSQMNAANSLRYKVVVNHEEQYSLWLLDMANPPGWRDTGFSDTREECLAYIRCIWTDMRPLSLRLAMQERTVVLPG